MRRLLDRLVDIILGLLIIIGLAVTIICILPVLVIICICFLIYLLCGHIFILLDNKNDNTYEET